MNLAIVHDWFSVYAGAEKCVESFTNLYPNADIYSLIDFLSDEDRKIILKGKQAKTSFIQKLPFAKTKYRHYLPLFPIAIEQFDLSEYDVVLSSSHAVAKGVLTHSNQIHITYMHTPIRYGWDLYHHYLRNAGLKSGLKGIIAKYFLHKLRIWDITTANRPDFYIANSKYIANRIKKVYDKEAEVIYPPVDVDKFELCEKKEDFYLAASRLVPYKKIDLIVEAFSKMPDKKLVVIGDGPDMGKIKKLASKNVEILGYQPFIELKKYMQKAKAYIFAAEEDFGIMPVEAQACGTPVIAYKKGGVTETVIEGISGLFFERQDVYDIISALNKFEKTEFDYKKIRENSLRFSRKRFEQEIKHYIEIKVNK